jgi:hypothetical protein
MSDRRALARTVRKTISLQINTRPARLTSAGLSLRAAGRGDASAQKASRFEPFDRWFVRVSRKCCDCRRWCYGATGGTTAPWQTPRLPRANMAARRYTASRLAQTRKFP